MLLGYHEELKGHLQIGRVFVKRNGGYWSQVGKRSLQSSTRIPSWGFRGCVDQESPYFSFLDTVINDQNSKITSQSFCVIGGFGTMRGEKGTQEMRTPSLWDIQCHRGGPGQKHAELYQIKASEIRNDMHRPIQGASWFLCHFASLFRKAVLFSTGCGLFTIHSGFTWI